MPTLIDLMKDPSVVVRDTTAWTVGRICELLPEAAINDVYLSPLLQCLIEGLGAEPRVASNVCWVSGNAGGRVGWLITWEALLDQCVGVDSFQKVTWHLPRLWYVDVLVKSN